MIAWGRAVIGAMNGFKDTGETGLTRTGGVNQTRSVGKAKVTHLPATKGSTGNTRRGLLVGGSQHANTLVSASG